MDQHLYREMAMGCMLRSEQLARDNKKTCAASLMALAAGYCLLVGETEQAQRAAQQTLRHNPDYSPAQDGILAETCREDPLALEKQSLKIELHPGHIGSFEALFRRS